MNGGSATGPVPPPELSVVSVVHTRHEFLARALDSALDQTLERGRYEVLLVATRVDPRWSEPYADRGVRVIPSGEPELGAKIAEGIQQARAPVVTFLEDDDRFETTKLAEVLRRFTDDPELAYYHNNFRPIGPDEAPWQGPFHRRGAITRIERRRRIYRAAGAPPGHWSAFRASFPGFNDSCISVRRDRLLPFRTAIARSGLLTDETLFFAAAASGGALLQDDASLTRVMVHPSSISYPVRGDRGVDVARLAEYSARTHEARRVIREIVASTGRRDLVDLAEAEVAIQDLVAALRDTGGRRSAYVGPLGAVLRRPSSLAFQNFPRVIALSTMALVEPGWARWIYRAAKARGA